jgi:hypothetical protein
MELKEIDVSVKYWLGSVQDGDYRRAVVNAALNLMAS